VRANSYEYLSPLGRANCKRPPWNFTYDQYGDIVLNTHFQRPPPEPKPSNADIMARQRIEGPACRKTSIPTRRVWIRSSTAAGGSDQYAAADRL